MARTTGKKHKPEVLILEPEPKVRLRTGRRVKRGIGDGIQPPTNKEIIQYNGLGRPSVYDPFRFPHIAYVLCKERGFTNEELARVFDVATGTVNQWVWLHEEFRRMVRRGRDEYDSENVENALRRRALGYKYTEKHVTKTKLVGKTPQGVEVQVPAISVTTVEKEIAPDPRSIMYWLQNRQPERWKNTLKIEVDPTANQPVAADEIDVEQMSTGDLLALRDMANKAVELQQKTIDVTPEHKRQLSVEEILAAADKAAEQQRQEATT